MTPTRDNNPTTQALNDVAEYMRQNQARRSFARREVAVFAPYTDAEIARYAPCPFDPNKIDPRKQFDVFIRDSALSEWKNICTEECAEWAMTLQNMIREERPWLVVKIWPKPRYA